MKPYYEHAGITIYHGDCRDVMGGLVRDSIDLVVTSPPYDDMREYGGHKWNFGGVASQLKRVLKPGGVIVWIVNDETKDGSKTGTSFKQALHFMEIGLRLHDTMIWDKGSFTAVGSLQVRYGPVTEFMFVLSKGKPKAFNAIRDRRNIHAGVLAHGTVRLPNGEMLRKTHKRRRQEEYGIRFNVWRMSPNQINTNRFHPGQFPEPLARDHILSWSNEGDTVLDPFNGSGTTTKMSRAMGRKAIGIEIEEKYCEIAAKRLQQEVFEFDE